MPVEREVICTDSQITQRREETQTQGGCSRVYHKNTQGYKKTTKWQLLKMGCSPNSLSIHKCILPPFKARTCVSLNYIPAQLPVARYPLYLFSISAVLVIILFSSILCDAPYLLSHFLFFILPVCNSSFLRLHFFSRWKCKSYEGATQTSILIVLSASPYLCFL